MKPTKFYTEDGNHRIVVTSEDDLVFEVTAEVYQDNTWKPWKNLGTTNSEYKGAMIGRNFMKTQKLHLLIP